MVSIIYVILLAKLQSVYPLTLLRITTTALLAAANANIARTIHSIMLLSSPVYGAGAAGVGTGGVGCVGASTTGASTSLTNTKVLKLFTVNAFIHGTLPSSILHDRLVFISPFPLDKEMFYYSLG
jgi:hypothetical protein